MSMKCRAASADPVSPSERAPLVLIADDNEDNRDMYAEFLSFAGYRTLVARDGAEAVQKAIESQPQVIAMDLSMPVMDGWEAIELLKANPQTKHIAIVALTGHAEPLYMKRAKEAGCDAFIAKPCLPQSLLAEVQRCVTAARPEGDRQVAVG